MSQQHDREKIAHQYGFPSYAALREVSQPVPLHDGDRAQAYLARHPNGYWFIWEEPRPDD